MAVPWMTLAKAVPWSDVIEHAPGVLNAARSLFKRKADGASASPGEPLEPMPGDEVGPLSTTELTQQLRAARTESAQLRCQLADTQQLLQDLAEQHARVLAQVEENRHRVESLQRSVRWLGGVAVVALVLGLGLLGASRWG